jgi:hypothetical protein
LKGREKSSALLEGGRKARPSMKRREKSSALLEEREKSSPVDGVQAEGRG